MQRPRHRRDRSLAARVVLATVKGTSLCGLFVLVVANGTTGNPSATPGTSAAAPQPDAYPRGVERAVAEHHCSYQGYDAGRVPASALIRTARGAVRQVDFEFGWDVYTGRRPGTLIAVCLEDGTATTLVSR